MLESGKAIPASERELLRKDGSLITVFSSHVYLEDERGEPLFYCLDIDISERVADKKRLTLLGAALDAAANTVILTDREGSILWANKAFTAITGYAVEEVIGKNPREFLKSGQHPPTFYHDMWGTILAGNVWSGEIINRKKDGTCFPKEATITPVRNTAGIIESFIAIKRDLTEEKAKEEQMLRMQRLEGIGTLAGGIAHDLNNALAPILMSTELMRHVEKEEDRRHLLEAIEVGAKRSAEMVKQVLSFARGVEGERIVLNPRHLANEITTLVRDTFPKNIQWHLQSPQGVHCILGDATQLHQVLLNLCVNARDAMPEGGTLSLALGNAHSETDGFGWPDNCIPGPYVKITVQDSGIGIPPEIIDRIFDPFFTTKAVGKGTGLGLSTAHSIVKNHGGFIRVHSLQGEGTVFEVYLPATPEVVDHMDHPVAHRPLPMGKGECVLVVDDDAQIRKSLTRLLEHSGYRVITAANGVEALDLHHRHRNNIHLVLTDMSMPLMGGPSFIATLRTHNPEVCIVGSSGALTHEDATTASGQAINHYIPKPYDASMVLETVRGALDASSADDAGSGV